METERRRRTTANSDRSEESATERTGGKRERRSAPETESETTSTARRQRAPAETEGAGDGGRRRQRAPETEEPKPGPKGARDRASETGRQKQSTGDKAPEAISERRRKTEANAQRRGGRAQANTWGGKHTKTT